MEFLIPYEKSYPHRKGFYKKALFVFVVFVLIIVVISLVKNSKTALKDEKITGIKAKPKPSLFDDLKIGEVDKTKSSDHEQSDDKILLKISNKANFDKKSRNEVKFMVIADCGGIATPPYYTAAQMKLARAMDAYSERFDTSFILSLGDNFSPAGIKDINDRRFVDTYEDPFGLPGLQIPWYVIAGNDDYRGNISAEMQYSQFSKRWNFPKKNYVLTGQLPGNNDKTLDIVMIDTVQLCGKLSPDGRLKPQGPKNTTEADEVWKWLENKLSICKSDYLIVAGHYPVYSGGMHGSTKCLQERLQPLLERYRVSAYMSGHDHSMQHIKSPGEGGVHYFVTGATSPVEDKLQHLDGVYKDTKFFWTNYLDHGKAAFTYCEITEKNMKVDFVTSQQVVIHTATILPRNES